MMMEAESTTNETMSDTTGERSIVPKDKREAVLMCCICTQMVNKKAKLLPCLHTLCRPCEITGMQEGKLTCSFCNQHWNAKDIVEHFLMKYLEAEPEAPKCDNCEENLTAKYKCIQCNDFLCVECSRAHQRVKITKDHTLKEIESTESPLDELKCSKHQNEELQWFCKTCDQNTCRNCQLESHSGHQYCTLEHSVQAQHQDIQRMNAETGKKVLAFEQVMKKVRERITEIDQADVSLRHELLSNIEQLQNALVERGKQLLTDIERVTQAKRSFYTRLKADTENLDRVARQVVHFTELTNECAKTVDIKQAHNKIAAAVNYVDAETNRMKHGFRNLQDPIQLSMVLPNTALIDQIKNYGLLFVDSLPPGVPMLQQQLAAPSHQSISGGNPNSIFPLPEGSPSVSSAAAPGARRRRASPKPRAPAPSQASRRGSMPMTSGQHQQQQPHPQPPPNQPTHNFELAQMAQMQFGGHRPQMRAMINAPLWNPHPMVGQHQHMQTPNQQLIQPNQMVPVSQVYNFVSRDAVNTTIQQRFPNVNQSFNSVQEMLNAHMPANHRSQIQIQNVSQMQYTNVSPTLPATSSSNYQQLQQCISGHQQNGPPPNFTFNPTVTQMAVGQVTQAPPPLVRFPGQCPAGPGQCGRSPTVLKSLAPRPTVFGAVVSQNVAPSPPNAAQAVPPPPPYQPGNQIIQLLQKTTENHLPSSDGAAPENRLPTPQTTVIAVDTSLAASGTGTGQTIRILPVTSLNSDNVTQVSNGNQNKDSSNEIPLTTAQIISNTTASALENIIAVASQANNTEPQSSNRSDIRKSVTPNIETSTVSKSSPATDKQSNVTTPASLKSGRTIRLAKKSIGKTTSYNSTRPKASAGSDGNASDDPSPAKRPKTTSPVETTEAPGQVPRPNSSISCYPSTEPFDCTPVFDDDVMICSPYDNRSAVSPPPTNSSVQPKLPENGLILAKNLPPIRQGESERRTPGANEVTTSTAAESQEEDDREWEDYCSVCQNGGDELLCCEAPGCTRVFHCYDHIPQFPDVPSSKLVCGFCINLEEYKSAADKIPPENRVPPRLTPYEQKLCEKMLLELYCHPESPVFHVPVDKNFEDYFSVIKRPMDFSTIRAKLASKSRSTPYSSVVEVLGDINQVFQNCSTFNDADSETGKAGISVGKAYKNFVRKYCPDFLRFVKRRKRN